MRVPVTEEQGTSPILIVCVAFLLAFAALLLLRAAPPPEGFTEWFPNSTGNAPNTAPAVIQSGAPAALAPIHARVGLQVGHWERENLPEELAILRTQGGASSGGYNEVDINYAVAHRVADILRARGITVDILPATIPPGYRADAFIAIHCDANNDPGINGFKLARHADSAIAARDDALINAITATYGPATGQRLDGLISRAMLYYYAFNSGDFAHAVSPQTPATIIELGFLTNAADRALLVNQQPAISQGLADGIIRFLSDQ
jgi:N-acetylmuramoyl-L-alanine amidase